MKINVKLLLITFFVVCIISVASAFVYFSLTVKILEQQQYRGLNSHKNNFAYNLRQTITDMDLDLFEHLSKDQDISSMNIDSTNIDILFTLNSDSASTFNTLLKKKNLQLNTLSNNYQNFRQMNTNVLISYYSTNNKNTIFYGKVIDERYLTKFESDQKYGIELFDKDQQIESSQRLSSTTNDLKFINIKDINDDKIYSLESEVNNIYYTLYKPKNLLFTGEEVTFLIYFSTDEISQFAETMQYTMVIIVAAGILLSLIFILLFTVRIRKQIESLDNAALKIKSGTFSEKAEIITKDEIGRFAETFNAMLTDLKRKSEEEKQYADFLTLLNSNPTLEQVAETSLSNIANYLEIKYGIMYLLDDSKIFKRIYFGISPDSQPENNDLLTKIIEQKEVLVHNIADGEKTLQSGFLSFPIKHVILYPIIYNNNVIAVIELASEKIEDSNELQYLNVIRDQLAIGLANAKAYNKLEVLVNDLKKLNEEYQNQNAQIRFKNKELINLHTTLQKKASELEIEKAKAVELTNLKSEFLASMSHELRTPLNSILGMSELLLTREGISKENLDDIQLVVKNGKLLLALISNILEFSKIESGRTELKNQRMKMVELLTDLQELITPLAKQKNLKFYIENSLDNDFEIITDKDKLFQILLNVLGNAIKFTDTGYIKLVTILKSKYEIIFEITDTGVGISEAEQKVIFDEFRQIEGGLARKFGGTGLGLTIAKKYTELLGGKISVESEKGVGSIFTISLPTKNEQSDPFDADKDIDKTDEKKILLYCDNSGIIEIFTKYFQLNGIDIIVEKNEEKLLSFPEIDSFIGVVINNTLFEKETWTTFYKLRANNRFSRIPLIMSNFDSNENIGYALFVYDFVTLDTFKTDTENIFNGIEDNLVVKINNLAFITDGTEKSEEYQNIFNTLNITEFKFGDNIISDLIVNAIDLVILPLSVNQFNNAPEIIRTIKKDKSTRNIPILVILDKEFSDSEAQLLNKSMDKILQLEKHHPLDVLKFIRNRFKLLDNVDALNSLFKEDFGREQSKLKRWKQSKILIVDDDNDTLYTVGEIVKDIGYQVSFARNGLECISQQRKEQPDLILLDIMMPQMDGFETIKRLRKVHDKKKLPIIALTAYAMMDNKDIIHKNGFNDLITKPIRRQEIEYKLSKIFKD